MENSETCHQQQGKTTTISCKLTIIILLIIVNLSRSDLAKSKLEPRAATFGIGKVVFLTKKNTDKNDGKVLLPLENGAFKGAFLVDLINCQVVHLPSKSHECT